MDTEYRRLMSPWPERALGRADFETASNDGSDNADAEIAGACMRSQAMLAENLLAMIHAQDPSFFENLVIDVLLAMGYGGRRRDLARRLGRTGDGGFDGVISQDELGLDLIYVQAKRLRPGTVVPVGEVRDFAGSLDAHRACKGIFVTTSRFSEQAQQFCTLVTRRVVLIDGPRFSDLMIRHNIGVRVKQSYQIKRIDLDYFSPSSSQSLAARRAGPLSP